MCILGLVGVGSLISGARLFVALAFGVSCFDCCGHCRLKFNL